MSKKTLRVELRVRDAVGREVVYAYTHELFGPDGEEVSPLTLTTALTGLDPAGVRAEVKITDPWADES